MKGHHVGDVKLLRTRKERSADELLLIAEGLKASMEELEILARLVLHRAVEMGVPQADIEALKAAADLTIKATDVLANTLEVGVESDALTMALEGTVH